jgi:diguanylate cyclase (GGDEF)-like protein
MHSVRLGSNRDVAYSMAAIKDAAQKAIGAVVVLRDATRILALTRKLTHLASHDALTDTLNRREFERCLDLALKSAAQQKINHVLLYIDIDQFKVVNDTCGHHAGDELLQRISHLLTKNIRSGDVIARLGGDEFAILLQRCNLQQAAIIAEKLRRTTHAARFTWENQIFTVTISIGAVEIDENSESASVTMSAADMACYTAKDLGKDRVHVYRKTDAELVSRRQEMHWVSHLNQALKQGRLSLYQQDIIPVAHESDEIRRVEVLLRLFDAEGALIPARNFLPAIERYGLINAIDRWVVRECFSIISSGEASDGTIYAINISGPSLSQTDFLDYIEMQFKSHAVRGSQLCFEITETSAVSHLRNARQFISELKSFGCYFALDDFGSGLSSFAYLKDLAVDFLKIDGSFVKNIVTDSVDRALVAAIKDVGHVMLVDTIAEHVENQAIMDVVRGIGIDYAQGALTGTPVPFGGRARELAGDPRSADRLNVAVT